MHETNKGGRRMERSEKNNKIMVWKIGALGDILMTTPFVRELRKKYKKVRIDYYVGKKSSQILKNNPNIDRVIEIDETIFNKRTNILKINKIIQTIKLIKKIKKEGYKEVYVLDKHWIYPLIMRLSGIKKVVGFYRDKLDRLLLSKAIYYNEPKHEIDYYLSLINKEDTKNKKMDYFLTREEIKEAKLFMNKMNLKKKSYIVVINSGGYHPGERMIRMMPDKLFKQLLRELSKKYKIVLVGGPNDKNYYDKFLTKNIINAAGKLSIGGSIALMKQAKRIYTTDCGPMHMAATVNDNITAIFGPTNPKRKAPRVKNLKVIWKDQDIYEKEYEDYGRVPKNKRFMEKVKIEDLI